MSYSKYQTKQLVQLSMFIAIIILQTWIPFLGYINLPPLLSVTYIHVTVIVACLFLGRRLGTWVALCWGINSLIRAYVAPPLPTYYLIFGSPLVSIFPRLIMGWTVGAIGDFLKGRNIPLTKRGVIGGVLGTVLNTLLVLGAIFLFKQDAYLTMINIAPQTASSQLLMQLLMGIVVTNAIPETIVAVILTPLLLKVLYRFK